MAAVRRPTRSVADRMVPRLAALLLAGCAVLWVAVLVATPVAFAHGYVVGPALVYEACGLVCHQRPERSFHLAGVQLPVCARCLGLYASGAFGAVVACAAAADRSLEIRPVRDTRWALAIASIPTALTLLSEWSGLWYPSGAARAFAAVPLGAVAGWVLVRCVADGRAEVRHSGQVRYHS